MKRLLTVFLLALFGAGLVGSVFRTALAADITLRFDPSVGATGYEIEMSTDLGVTWGGAQDTGGATTYTFVGVPEDMLVLFRAVAYNAAQEATRYYSGAWYDHRNLPILPPSGAGIQ